MQIKLENIFCGLQKMASSESDISIAHMRQRDVLKISLKKLPSNPTKYRSTLDFWVTG